MLLFQLENDDHVSRTQPLKRVSTIAGKYFNESILCKARKLNYAICEAD